MTATPELQAQDLEATRRAVAETSSEDFAGLVARFRTWYTEGDLAAIWQCRCRYGMSAGEDDMGREVWFWFNALSALAGLKLRKLPGFPLANYCGAADISVDWDSPEERRVKDEINHLYFGE